LWYFKRRKGEYVMPFNQHHLERAKNEVFVGNVRVGKGLGVAWETARLGINAYDVYGNSLQDRYLPVFVTREEIREKNPNFLERLESVDASK
jgi:hypothetical protein